MELAGKSLEDDDVLVRLERLETELAASDGHTTKTEYRWEGSVANSKSERAGWFASAIRQLG
jgi:hypothetical protein